MKQQHLRYSLIAILAIISLVGCEEDEDTNGVIQPPGPINTGSANFDRYVTIGNSITAGFQSNALSERDQQSSYGNLIAQHLGKEFEQPLMQNPGVGARMRLVSLTGPVIVNEQGVDPTNPASNLNVNLPRPYNNLGIPGAILFDMADTTDFVMKSQLRQNPFFALILRNGALGRSILQQAAALNPTFVTAWIGNNDVLGYATSGGVRGTNVGLSHPPGTRPTESLLFDTWYRQVLDALKLSGAGIIVGNIPDVSTIPFFTTVGPTVAASIPPGIYLRYQKAGNNSVAFDSTRLTEPDAPLLLLTGITYARLLGQPTGQWYRDNNITTIPPGIDTTRPFGFHPQNPWPNALALDAGEQAIVATSVAEFNQSIDSLASNRGIGVADFRGLWNTIRQSGIYASGYGTFSAAYITGGTFSYDGVHSSSRGNVIIANEWIRVINQRFGAQIPPVPYGDAPGMPIGKVVAGNMEIGDLDFLLRILGAQ